MKYHLSPRDFPPAQVIFLVTIQLQSFNGGGNEMTLLKDDLNQII